mmetsp:Transcript_140994/g.351613  ORF Transcript_140994/g.351613 Transcript_140994/m.351613 type:complete len:241 (+) Transcript_140994:79-801(+)
MPCHTARLPRGCSITLLLMLVFILAFVVASAVPQVEDVTSASEVCDDEDCAALELRQLRVRVLEDGGRAMPVQSEGFGLDAVGKNMWSETTWQDVLLEVRSNTSSICDSDTGGSCDHFGCSSSRGAVECMSNRCVCRPGYCARNGFCYPQEGQCIADTGGTCSLGACWYTRGKTKCKSGKCLCKTGGCAWKGKCFPVTDTGVSCHHYPCAASRGPTTCHRGRCLCQQGHVAVSGSCEPWA